MRMHPLNCIRRARSAARSWMGIRMESAVGSPVIARDCRPGQIVIPQGIGRCGRGIHGS